MKSSFSDMESHVEDEFIDIKETEISMSASKTLTLRVRRPRTTLKQVLLFRLKKLWTVAVKSLTVAAKKWKLGIIRSSSREIKQSESLENHTINILKQIHIISTSKRQK